MRAADTQVDRKVADDAAKPSRDAGTPSRLPAPAVLQRAQVAPRSLAPGDVLQLQRSIGNRAVHQLLGAAAPRPSPPRGTGSALPGPLRVGIERLSGMAMDDVSVHRDSPRPARLLAAAYTQGNEIHLGPGQERHLAHEAWHVVQQRQRRVPATTRVAGAEINTDASLEREADAMGAQAAGIGSGPEPRSPGAQVSGAPSTSAPLQRLVELTREHVGQYFLVARGPRRVKLKLLDVQGERGVFQGIGSTLSIHKTNVFPLDHEESESSSSSHEEHDEEHDEKEKGEGEGEGSELLTYEKEQAACKLTVTSALDMALEKLRVAVRALGGLKDERAAFAEPMSVLLSYLSKLAASHAEDIGQFRCLPNQDGPSTFELASTLGGIVTLFKPFFALPPTRQGDILIHESVHACFGVTDYAYLWQHIFRFLPIETQLKNPDSFVAVARTLAGEGVETPNSGHHEHDRTLGLIQHICFRGLPILSTCKAQIESFDNAPPPLATLKQLRDNYSKGQLVTLLDKAKHADPIASLIAANRIQITSPPQVPTKLDEGTVELKEGKFQVTYIASTAVAPHVAILAKLLTVMGCSRPEAVAVAKALDEMTSAKHSSTKDLKPV